MYLETYQIEQVIEKVLVVVLDNYRTDYAVTKKHTFVKSRSLAHAARTNDISQGVQSPYGISLWWSPQLFSPKIIHFENQNKNSPAAKHKTMIA